jgi:hypothetical protein
MNQSTQNAEFFRTLAKVLLRCWIFGFILLFLWLGAILLGSGLILRPHGDLFELSKHDLDVIAYCGLGLLKLVVLMFFFFPWSAIRLVLRGMAMRAGRPLQN